MSKRRSMKTRPSLQGALPVMEPLEPRLLLSGNVVVTPIGASLFINGDAAANDILIQQGADFTVTGRNGTTVNGTAADTPVAFPTMNADIWAWMSDGSDTLEIGTGVTVPGSVFVDGAAGDNSVIIGQSTINGNVFVFNGLGLDTFYLYSGEIVGNLTLLNGDGGSDTTLANSTLDGNATIFNGAGEDEFTLNNGLGNYGILGSLFLVNGDGGSHTSIEDSAVGGSVTIFNGAGKDRFHLTGGDGIGAGLFIVNGDGGSCTTISDSFVEKDVTILNGEGYDRFTLDGSDDKGAGLSDPVGPVVDAQIAGNLFISNGNGGSKTRIIDAMVGSFRTDSTDGLALVSFQAIGGNVTILNGDEKDKFTLDNSDSLGNGGIIGNLFIVNGEGDSSTRLIDTNVGGIPLIGVGDLVRVFAPPSNVTVLNGTGHDCFNLDNTDAGDGIGGNLFIANGSGGAHTTLTQSIVDGSATIFNNGCWTSTTLAETYVGGSLNVFNGDGRNHVTVDDILVHTIGGDLLVVGGSGVDTVAVAGYGILGNVYMNTGLEDDTVSFTNSSVAGWTKIIAGPDYLSDGQSDQDSVSLVQNVTGSSAFIGGVWVWLGADDDSATFGGSNPSQLIAFGSTAMFDGGPGANDSANEGYFSIAGALQVLNFEFIVA